MARARKPHPADVANVNVVASAVRFEIALFLGVGRYATDTAETLDEARRKAARLVAMHRNGRRPLIYGVTADGRSGLVTDTPNMEDPMKTYAKNSTLSAPQRPPATILTRSRSSRPRAVSWMRDVAIREAARRGELPAIPDFSAETHKRFRNKLAQVAALIEAGDVAASRHSRSTR